MLSAVTVSHLYIYSVTYFELCLLQEKRTDIGREFNTWLKECHEYCDKQVKFSHYTGSVTRPELVKYRQTPWSVYEQIEWDGKVFKKGTMVGSVNVNHGTKICYSWLQE